MGVGNNRAPYQKQSIDVSLYKYLDDHRDSNPANPLNYENSSQIYQKYNSKNDLGFQKNSSVRTFASEFTGEPSELGRVNSRMEYKFNTYGGVDRNISIPGNYRIGERGQTVQNMILSFPELEKQGLAMGNLDEELQINNNLLKTGKGYLDVCKGLLDSIHAVQVGDVRYAQNLMGNNKVVLGNSSAKQGKHHLKIDHGIDLDTVEPTSERYRLLSEVKDNQG